MPSKNFLDYSKSMRKFMAWNKKAVSDFVNNYDEYKQEAKVRLKGMFRAADYPSKSQIAHRYGFSMDIEPVPISEDFRVNIQDKDAARIKAEIEKRARVREAEAMKDLFVRLNTVLNHFNEKLSDMDSIFRDSIVENIVELVNLLPKLNVANDPALENLRKETQRKICQYEPMTLRKDKAVRKQAARDAKAILDKMAGYMG